MSDVSVVEVSTGVSSLSLSGGFSSVAADDVEKMIMTTMTAMTTTPMPTIIPHGIDFAGGRGASILCI